MKNSVLFTLLFAFLAFYNLQAATLTVNNLNTLVGQYNTVQAAVDAAASGDVILIQGSPTNYGNVEIPATKALTFRGPGWRPLYKQSTFTALLGTIYLAPNAHDIIVEGLVFYQIEMKRGDYSPTESRYLYDQYNITVQLCQVDGYVYINDGCRNFFIRNNRIAHVSGANQKNSDILIENNIFNGAVSSFNSSTNVLVQHNLFFGGGVSSTNNIIVQNNIFYQCNTNTGGSGNIFANNLTYRSDNSPEYTNFTASGNFISYSGTDLRNKDPLFVKHVLNGGFDPEANYRLQSGSPGKNAGTDGKDVGPYTDTFIFSMTGETAPAVRSFQINNPITTPNGTLNIRMTASKARLDGN